MRNSLEDDNLKLRKRISNWLSCDKKNIIITRNTTESLDLIIGVILGKKEMKLYMLNRTMVP